MHAALLNAGPAPEPPVAEDGGGGDGGDVDRDGQNPTTSRQCQILKTIACRILKTIACRIYRRFFNCNRGTYEQRMWRRARVFFLITPLWFFTACAILVLGDTFAAYASVLLEIFTYFILISSPASGRMAYCYRQYLRIARNKRVEPQFWRRHEWRKYISASRIRWVKASAIRRWSREDGRFPRCQTMDPQDHVVGGAELGRVVVSHPWYADYHPDPEGIQLQRLSEVLCSHNIASDALVFYDFCSLPQMDKSHPHFRMYENGNLPAGHPSIQQIERSRQDDIDFFAALGKMEMLYSEGYGRVLVLPFVPVDAHSPTPYINRGWCFFEFSIAASSGRILNDGDADVRAWLEECRYPLGDKGFRKAFQGKCFTHRGDRDNVSNLFNAVESARLIRLIKIFVALIGWQCLLLFCVIGISFSDRDLAHLIETCLLVLLFFISFSYILEAVNPLARLD